MAAAAISTDLYELTMLAGYVDSGRHESVTSTFELFVRRLPPHRNYLILAGLEALLDYLEALHFSDDDIRWLRDLPAFRGVPSTFFDYLRRFRFEGDVSAIAEGVPVFTNEPLVQITAPLGQAQIVASGDLDEHIIADLLARAAPIDGFGVGTSLVTSIDAPALTGVYKLVALSENGAERGAMKRSEGKATWPGRKQVWRVLVDGIAARDIVALEQEPPPPDAVALLEPVMRSGRRIRPSPTLDIVRRRREDLVRALPGSLLAIDRQASYRVEPGGALRQLISPI